MRRFLQKWTRQSTVASRLLSGFVLGALAVSPCGLTAQMTGFANSDVVAQRRFEQLLIDAIQPPILQ